MQKTLVWEILSALSKKETKLFGAFLQSPFHNKRADLIRAHQVLTSYASKTKKIAPNKPDFFKKVFPVGQFDDQKLRLTISRLHKLLEEFLIISTLNKTPFEKEKLLATAYRSQKMTNNFNRTYRKTEISTLKQPLRNANFYFQIHQLEHQKYLSVSKVIRSKSFNLEKVEQYLDIAYISSKLRQACFKLSHHAVSNVAFNSLLFEEIMTIAQEDFYQKEPAISLYYHFIALFPNGKITEFSAFRQRLFDYRFNFTHEEFNDIYLLALNFCIKKINQNNKPFFQETLDMYKEGLNLSLLFEQHKMSRFTYNNIVAIALYLGDLQWISDFIEQYKSYLKPSFQHATYSLNIARLSFVKKEFKAALTYLQMADHEDLISHMTAKILQLKIYYELQEFDSLDSLIQSLRVFIQRKKRIGYHYHLWRNILKYTHKIRKVNPYDKKAILALRIKIEQAELLPERSWLLEKLKT